MITYEQARADHEYLWNTYAPADDMTGGYVDSKDLDRLLEKPTKATARECYRNQIHYWFDVGPDRELSFSNAWLEDEKVLEIAKRHYCQLPKEWSMDELFRKREPI